MVIMTIFISLTGSFFLSIVGFFLAKLVVEPVGVQQGLRKRIAVSLRYWAHFIYSPLSRSDENVTRTLEAKTEFRTLGCEIMASYYLITNIKFLKKYLVKIGWVLPEDNCRIVGRLLTGLSNSLLGNEDEYKKWNCVRVELIQEFIGIPDLDYGWIGEFGSNLNSLGITEEDKIKIREQLLSPL